MIATVHVRLNTAVCRATMSLFASAGKSNKQLGQRIKQVRSVLEHIGLYVGLAVYTAAGAKVNQFGLTFGARVTGTSYKLYEYSYKESRC